MIVRLVQDNFASLNIPPPVPGTRFDSYEILAAIGAGGMGEVYRARDTSRLTDG